MTNVEQAQAFGIRDRRIVRWRKQVTARETFLGCLGKTRDVFGGALLLLRSSSHVPLRGVEGRSRHTVVARRGEHGFHTGVVALGGSIAGSREQTLVEIVVEARDDFRGSARLAQRLDRILG